MKTFILLTVAFCWAMTAFCQDVPIKQFSEPQTFFNGVKHFGFFGGVTFKSSTFNNQYVTLTGLRGGVIINRSVAMGIEFNGIIPFTSYNNISEIGKAYAVGGLAGFFLEPVFFSNNLVHFTLPVSAGGGWIGYIEDYENDHHNHWDDGDDLIDGDMIWYVEPGITAEANVTAWFRIAAGFSHRFVQDMYLYRTSPGAFSTNNYILTLKFGKF